MKTEYKYGQYCTPLSQSDCRYFFCVSDNREYSFPCYYVHKKDLTRVNEANREKCNLQFFNMNIFCKIIAFAFVKKQVFPFLQNIVLKIFRNCTNVQNCTAKLSSLKEFTGFWPVTVSAYLYVITGGSVL